MILTEPAAVSRLSRTGSSYGSCLAPASALCVTHDPVCDLPAVRAGLSNMLLCYIFWTFTLLASYPFGVCPRIPQLRSNKPLRGSVLFPIHFNHIVACAFCCW